MNSELLFKTARAHFVNHEFDHRSPYTNFAIMDAADDLVPGRLTWTLYDDDIEPTFDIIKDSFLNEEVLDSLFMETYKVFDIPEYFHTTKSMLVDATADKVAVASMHISYKYVSSPEKDSVEYCLHTIFGVMWDE